MLALPPPRYDSLCARLKLANFALSQAERQRIADAHAAAMPRHVDGGGTHMDMGGGGGEMDPRVLSPARRQITGAPTPNGSPLSSAPRYPVGSPAAAVAAATAALAPAPAPAASPAMTMLPGAPRRQLTGGVSLNLLSSASLLRCDCDGVAATSVRSEASKAASLAASRQCVQLAERAIAERRALHAEAKEAKNAGGAPAPAAAAAATPVRRPSRGPSEAIAPSRAPSVLAATPVAEEDDEEDDDEEGVVRVAQLQLKLLLETADAAATRAELGLPEIDLATPPVAAAPQPAAGGGADDDGGGGEGEGGTCRGDGAACGTARGAAAAALGRVHARLCEYAQSGNLPLQVLLPLPRLSSPLIHHLSHLSMSSISSISPISPISPLLPSLPSLLSQEGVADVGSAAFHLVCAAACGEPRALRDLRALAQVLLPPSASPLQDTPRAFAPLPPSTRHVLLPLSLPAHATCICPSPSQGISADELLPGMALPPAEAEAMGAQHLPMLTRRLAAAGDPDAILAVANGEAAAGRPKQAVAWLEAAVDGAVDAQAAAAASPKGGGRGMGMGMGMGMGGGGVSSLGASLHVLLEKLGDAQLAAGDPEAAAASLQAASEAAMEAGKMKLAMKLTMRSEEVAGMVEEE